MPAIRAGFAGSGRGTPDATSGCDSRKGCVMPIADKPPIMTWDDVLHALDDIEDPPREILSWASAHWDEAASRLVDRFGDFAAGRRESIPGTEAFYIAHLSAEKGETRAYPILCRMIAQDARIADWLDDAVTETLPGILIRVFDGDASPLGRAVESADGDEFARASALAALGYLVRAKAAMPDAAMQAFLRRIRRETPPRRDSVLWMTWAATAASLGYDAMRFEVAKLRNDGFIPGGDFNREEFDLRVELARSDASGLAGFRYDRVAPLEDATSAVLALAGAELAEAGRRLRAFAVPGKDYWR